MITEIKNNKFSKPFFNEIFGETFFPTIISYKRA